MENKEKEQDDAFGQVAAIFAASGVKITSSMLELMSPLLSGEIGFEEHRAFLKTELALKAELDRVE